MMKFFIVALLTVLAMAMTAVSGGDGYSKQGEFNIIDLPEPHTDGVISVEDLSASRQRHRPALGSISLHAPRS